MKVKICGIKSYEDARTALDAGAWALGFIFHPPSRRYVDPEEAGRILRKLPRETLSVGVFVDFPLDDLRAFQAASGIRGVQLHGMESPEYARAVNAELVIKALRVGERLDTSELTRFPGCRILLDAFDPSAAGGTGKTFDWELARRAAQLAPIILAGGIGPGNVAEAVRKVRPDAIDVSSGVEISPGVKDGEKIRELFRALQNLDEEEGSVGSRGP